MASGRRAKLSAVQALELITADSDSDFSERDVDLEDNDYEENLEHFSADDQLLSIDSESELSETDWRRTHNFDDYVPIWCVDYTKEPGPKLPDYFRVDVAEPYDYFLLFFPESGFDWIRDMINLYAEQFFDQPSELPTSSRFLSWTDTTSNEVKSFMGLQIAMSLCAKPSIEDYWRKRCRVTATSGFSDIMSRNRFGLLCSFLHFSDNSKAKARGEHGYDPLQKIRPLLDITMPCLSLYYTPLKELSVDESMRKFEGRIYFRQYIPNKPTRWGIKIWTLCESKTGFLLNYDIYTGKKNIAVGPKRSWLPSHC